MPQLISGVTCTRPWKSTVHTTCNSSSPPPSTKTSTRFFFSRSPLAIRTRYMWSSWTKRDFTCERATSACPPMSGCCRCPPIARLLPGTQSGGRIRSSAQGADSKPALPQPQATGGSPHCNSQRLGHPRKGSLNDPRLDARSSKRWRSELKSNY